MTWSYSEGSDMIGWGRDDMCWARQAGNESAKEEMKSMGGK
jgi:hypothetical protein